MGVPGFVTGVVGENRSWIPHSTLWWSRSETTQLVPDQTHSCPTRPVWYPSASLSPILNLSMQPGSLGPERAQLK